MARRLYGLRATSFVVLRKRSATMKRMWIVAAAASWLACSVLSYGIGMAYWQRWNDAWSAHNCRYDQSFQAVHAAMFGPVSLMVTYFVTGFAEYGLRWTCPGNPVHVRPPVVVEIGTLRAGSLPG